MPSFHTKTLGYAAVLLAVSGAPAAASQPLWQPAIYCAALDLTRADLMSASDAAFPDWVGSADAAGQSGRAYLRIATEALDCPGDAMLDNLLSAARLSIRHRIETAMSYGMTAEILVLPLSSESELVCGINFDATLLDAARAAEAATPPPPLCGDAE